MSCNVSVVLRNKGGLRFGLSVRQFVSVSFSNDTWDQRTWFKYGATWYKYEGFLFPSRLKLVAILWVCFAATGVERGLLSSQLQVSLVSF